MSDNEVKIEKVHCNICLQKTKHFLIAERVNSDSESVDPKDPYCIYEISWRTTYTMLECCGCENVTLRRQFYFSEWDEIEEEFYPPPISRNLPKWIAELPNEWEGLLREIYTALHANSRCLSLMGARTLIDLYLNDKVGDIGGFKQKINKLEDLKLISRPNKEFLEVALEAGHASAHRGYKAESEEVNQVMDIVENLLQEVALEKSVLQLKANTPSRKPRKSN